MRSLQEIGFRDNPNSPLTRMAKLNFLPADYQNLSRMQILQVLLRSNPLPALEYLFLETMRKHQGQ